MTRMPCDEEGANSFPEEDHPKVKLKECEGCLNAMEEGIMYTEALKSLNGNKNAPRGLNGMQTFAYFGPKLPARVQSSPLQRRRSLLRERILKDTEVHLTHKDVSPQYSLRSQDSLPPDLSSLASVSLYPSRHNSVSSTCTAPDPGLVLLEEEEEPAPPAPPAPTVPDCKNDKCEITEKHILSRHYYSRILISVRSSISFISFFIFLSDRFRQICNHIASKKAFDYAVLFFISLNCITLAMERPTIPPGSLERTILTAANYMFTVVFAIEMFIKVIAKGLWYGNRAYFKSGWNVMDGSLVIISLVDFCLSFIADGSPRIFGILRVFPPPSITQTIKSHQQSSGTKTGGPDSVILAQTHRKHCAYLLHVLHHLWHIGCTVVQGKPILLRRSGYQKVKNKTDCEADARNQWVNQRYNFDNLGQALMSLFVLSSKDGWVNIMYTGLDAVGVDQQPIVNYNEWRLLYFISFLLLVAFFVLNMFVGVVVENFHRCREEQEKEEKALRAAKRAKKMEKKKRKMREPPYYINYSKPRLLTHNIITSKYFDLAIAAVIGLNVVTMATEFYMMPMELVYALKIPFRSLESVGCRNCHSFRNWYRFGRNGTEVIPINPTIIRVMRVLRIARVLKLLKMAKGIPSPTRHSYAGLASSRQPRPTLFLLFFIFAALGVELFGRLECTDDYPCQGLGEHAHFRNFGMAFLTLFRVATGDNWNGIMKDTLRENCDPSSECIRNCCVSPVIAPLYFVVFVLMAQFVLVNVVVAVLMKHLEESHKHMDDDIEIDAEIERQLAAELAHSVRKKDRCHDGNAAFSYSGRDRRREARKQEEMKQISHRKLVKMSSLPANFIFRFSDDVEAKNAALMDRTAGAQYSPLATISAEGPSPTLSWPVASTSSGRRHTLDTSYPFSRQRNQPMQFLF
ncbi:voltage-dependent T-type calcium channel subunit alpha-1G [Caerostris extrusa]|uniref:Voltage-dependent T-type calcium channel subunit alpha-1G n=1 Tax=Caerostris extrusa TaxID=172846 RepID=A0AAV4PH08_CAEEX|nr:voltage-dependent T-type calcium channel subunit alpha-1G [Caerostris extrusa]